jgi:hypothetical protein
MSSLPALSWKSLDGSERPCAGSSKDSSALDAVNIVCDIASTTMLQRSSFPT